MAIHQQKLLCLPIDLFKREFFIKMYVALVAVKHGYQVIVGENNEKVFKRIKNGVFLLKDHGIWHESRVKSAKKRGMINCAIDEEALIIGDTETYIRTVSSWLFEL